MIRWLRIFFATLRHLLLRQEPQKRWLCEGCNRVIEGIPVFYADDPYHDNYCIEFRKYGRYDRSERPLIDVDLNETQGEMFGNECAGVCGV